MLEPHQRLARLFAGRTDAWGLVHGEACKLPLRDVDWWKHVNADGSVGVYPLVGVETTGHDGPYTHWKVKWGCVDIDDGYEAGLVVARNLHKAYSVLGLTSWIERTKGKGYHVWLLCSDWVPAVQMRAVQIIACNLIEYRPKEINPKQVTLEEGSLGNYVNIPYAKRWYPDKRVVLGRFGGDESNELGSGWYGLEPFLDAAENTRNTPTKIAEVAALYREPPKPKAVNIEPSGGEVGLVYPRLSPLTKKVLDEGPLPHPETGHIDRSAGLQRLAHLAAKDGLRPGEVYMLVVDLDMRLGKYTNRPDADKWYRQMVERAYLYAERDDEGEPDV